MTLNDLPQRVDRLAGFDSLLSVLQAPKGRGQIEGLTGATRALAIARLFQLKPAPLLVVTFQQEQAQRLLDDLRQLGVAPAKLFLLPSLENRWLSDDVIDYMVVGDRIAALNALASGEPCIVVGAAEGVFQRTTAPNELLTARFTLTSGQTMQLERVMASLVDMGYESESTVARPGQFSHRGGILDIYPSTTDLPVRIELFGDEIESIRSFDVATQRSTGPLEQIDVLAAREVRLTPERIEAAVAEIRAALHKRKMALAKAGKRDAFDALTARIEDDITRLENAVYFDGLEEYLPYLAPEAVCAVDYLPQHSLVILDEPGQAKAHFERVHGEIAESRDRRWERGELLDGPDHPLACAGGFERIARAASTLVLTQLPRQYEEFPAQQKLAVSTAPMTSFRAQLQAFADEVQTWSANGADCLIVTTQPQRVREICAELTLDIAVTEGRLRQGFKFADVGLFVATDAELFGTATAVAASRRRAKVGIPVSTILDLRENDYVVHVHHGIGLYRGLVKRKVEGADRDYLLVEYAGGDRLYVPADQIDRVQRYIGGEAAPPAISRIGGNEWQRTTRKVKEQAREMAKELIELYAARQKAQRTPFGPDSPWQAEMEEAFPYEETPSQLKAINDVKGDLQEYRPMDRLVCGDVGFGKTEVAIRAAFKAVDAGRQVAVLCPTTVLAAQHHTTFSERLAPYPCKVELLSRFRSRQEQNETIAKLKAGAVDIVVGTHRVLSKDVEFRDLGLVIVDEEQRFGVGHKERLKQLRKSVDVLTLTATPIPRTLSMALSGLRDMSVIEDPPSGRRPIITRVSEYDEELVRDAILRELERDGQLYFVHNRIESIDYVAERVQKLAPEARIRIGHGQMSEDELEKIMFDFYHQQFDVLVCTTIIENGLDVPNVNTIIVDRADRMGLAQLYQLRGRVGRSNRQAYAYLLYRPNKQLTEIAESRLMAIREFTALGSGFQVAMRDLEIRGAGNLLGPEQSGAIVSVGYDLYCEILAQAVSELKGEEPMEATLPPVDLPVTAHIPDDYVPNEAERIFFYKRMSNVRSADEVRELQEELEDRYGDPPRPVWNALEVLRLRLRAREAGIGSIRGERKDVTIRLAPHARLAPDAIKLLTYAFKNHRFTADSVVVPLTSTNVLREVEEMVNVLERAVQYGKGIGREAAAR